MQDPPHTEMTAQTLLAELAALRTLVLADAAHTLEPWEVARPVPDGIVNLSHYLALRRHDLRPVQRRLMALGLSSLGRLEGRVLPTLDAVISALAALAGRDNPVAAPLEAAFFAGEVRLATAADALLGPAAPHRRCRIMVTLPGTAAADPDMILDLARRGMDIVRINCAHDDAAAWRAMAAHARRAASLVGRPLSILMDIAGPKIRTGEVRTKEKKARLQAGDALRLVASGEPWCDAHAPFAAAVSLAEIVRRLSPGERLRYDDGALEGVVEGVDSDTAIIRIVRAKGGGVKLKPEKGLNLPDTALGLSPLTDKDQDDLATVVECADMIGYSFVSRPEDIDLLERALDRCAVERKPGLVAKIERPEAVTNLPGLMARAAAKDWPFGVMIARGDLAAEIGFERVAEMQEEILWLCEAAGVPVIWATQVLEDLVKDGVPSRGEMTDAAMAARAECVMLNKGPAVAAAVDLLDRLLARMDGHIVKKTPTLRALKSW
ncbi:pyruvate kinase [Niveispirillum lacus]|nr:pyruvate kinase [Niveispirillum lacus]